MPEEIELNPRVRIIGVVIIVSILLGVGFLFLTLEDPSDPLIVHNFVWSVNAGQTLDYTMTFEPSSDGEMEDWEPFDGAAIQITISSLPSLPSPITVSEFLSDITRSSKVEARFANGSTITQNEVRGTIQSTLSYFLFPTGGWEVLHETFGQGIEETIPAGEFPDKYYYQGTYHQTDYFSFRDEWSQQSSGHGSYGKYLYGIMFLETGIPSYASYGTGFYHVAGVYYEVTFTLVDDY